MASHQRSSSVPRKHPSSKHIPYQPPADAVLVCKQKKRYANKLEAERAAELGMLEHHDVELSVYQCQQCHKWHLTSSS